MGHAAAILTLAAAAGCGKPVLRLADASLGDYYTDEEFKRLREEQREEYCRELAEQDSIYREEIAEARSAAAVDAVRATKAGAEADSLAALAEALEGTLETRRAAARAAVEAPAASVVVRRGDSLWGISGRSDVYGDPRLWPRLFEANRDRIRDADLIFPEQELRVPR